jgi:hypothetical protein
VWEYSSVIVEKGAIIRDWKGIERLRTIKEGGRIDSRTVCKQEIGKVKRESKKKKICKRDKQIKKIKSISSLLRRRVYVC